MSRMDDIRKEYAIQQEKERYLEFLRGIEGTPFRKLSLAQRQWLKDNHPYLYNRGVEHSEEPVRDLLYLDKAKQKKKVRVGYLNIVKKRLTRKMRHW